MPQNGKIKKERDENMLWEKIIMIKLAELLSRENLISPDEQVRFVREVREGEKG